MNRPIIIVANRKMNADKKSLKAWGKAMRDAVPEGTTVIAALPCTYLQKSYLPKNISLSAQNCHAEESGAFTGSVSASMLRDVGVEYVILGHSERRAVGETSAEIRKKAEAVLTLGMKPIICVGESLEMRESGKAVAFTEGQLRDSLPADLQNVIVAYEPIWAIGTGKSATPEDAQAMHAVLREVVTDKTPILYGGSVKPENTQSYMQGNDIDGVLVGSACLDPESFADIVREAANSSMPKAQSKFLIPLLIGNSIEELNIDPAFIPTNEEHSEDDVRYSMKTTDSE